LPNRNFRFWDFALLLQGLDASFGLNLIKTMKER
jgi:hypothetical protein